VKTQVANLVRHKSSGIYFARIRIKRKLYFMAATPVTRCAQPVRR